jgi:hypothetical protein
MQIKIASERGSLQPAYRFPGGALNKEQCAASMTLWFQAIRRCIVCVRRYVIGGSRCTRVRERFAFSRRKPILTLSESSSSALGCTPDIIACARQARLNLKGKLRQASVRAPPLYSGRFDPHSWQKMQQDVCSRAPWPKTQTQHSCKSMRL